MKLSEVEKQELENIYQGFLHDERIIKMKEIPMHRGSNCYYHSFKVAKKAIHNALRHKKEKVNLITILLGAILHDYYLYNWRNDKALLKKHGKVHPYVAAQNAKDDFGITEVVQKVIKSHMWPLNFKEYPNSKEARIVTIADKMVTTGEALTFKAFKKRREEKYKKYIEHLF